MSRLCRLARLQQHGDAAPLEVERDLVQLDPFADVRFRVSEDRVVERTVDAGLERAIEKSKSQHLRTIHPLRIDMAHEPDLGFGKGAGLIGTQRVHRPEVMDRRQPLGDDTQARETQRATRQRHGDHHGQELRRETDRERERKHDRLEPWPMEQHVGDQHEQHEKEGQAQDQEPELAHPDLEGIGRPAVNELAGETADARFFPRPAYQRACDAANDRGAQEHHILRVSFG